MYDVLVNSRPLAEVRQQAGERLWVGPSHIDLAAAEVELAGVVGREVILRDLLQQEEETFDYVFMDCAPSLGVLTLNALAAANEVFIPLQPHFLALHGIGKLFETTALVARRINPGLRVSGIVICLYEPATKLAQEVIGDLQEFLDKSRGGSTPWANAQVFETRIRRNIKLAECPSFGRSILEYAPTCNGAADYRELAREVLSSQATVMAARASIDDRGHVAVNPTAAPAPTETARPTPATAGSQ
jgi:chromosome partitioning protein